MERSELRTELAGLLADGLPYLAGTLAILAVVYAFAHRYLLDPPIPSWVFLGLLAGAATYVLLLAWMASRTIRDRWAYPITVGLTCVIVLNLLSIGWVRQEPVVTIDWMLLVLAQGLFVLDRRWLTLALGLTLGGYGLVVWHAAPDPAWGPFAYGLVSALFIAGGLNVFRQRQVVRHLGIQKHLEVQNKELARLRDEAEAAERAKAALLANTSHEIRTPLNAITGMSELLAEEDLSPTAQGYLQTIRTSSEHLLHVVDDILDVSKLEADRFDLEAIPFPLRDCIDDVIEILAPRAGQKGLELRTDVGRDVPDAIVGDPTRLRQILVNLVSNAVKFTPEGRVELRVRRAGEGASHRLRFEVEDTGIGVPEESQADLFKPFAQLDPSTTRRYGGSGLGLSISRRLVEKMGGRIGIHSTVGEGSTFWFEIPVVETDLPDPLPWTLRPGVLPGRRVLVVGSDDRSMEILEQQLESWRLEPVFAGSAREAIERLAEGRVDLVLLDLELEGEDGAGLARRIREEHPREELPIVLLSPSPPDRGPTAAVGIRVDGFLTKPPQPSTLYELLIRLLSDPEQVAPDADEGLEVTSLARRHPLSLLVAEDNEINRRVVAKMLEHMGYEPVLVADGAGVLEALQAQRFDVVLMDVQMPGIDGIEATRRIREELEDPPAIIALTAHAGIGDRERLLAVGMDDYLAKPVDLRGLARALRCVSSARKAQEPSS